MTRFSRIHKPVIICAVVLTVGALSACADILVNGLSWLPVDQTTDWAYNDMVQNFDSGGAFEGYRYATIGEVWALTESYGYDPVATAEVNADAVAQLQQDLGYTYASSALEFNVWTFGFTNDGTRFDLRLVMPNPDQPETFQGYAYETDYPYYDLASPQIGHYLVQVIPEPSTISLVLSSVFLALVLLRKRLGQQ